MMTDLSGKTVLITGATSGIGEATAIALARQRARVLAVGRDQARGAAVVQELMQLGGTGEFLSANLLSLKDVARLANEVMKRTSSVDVLINNAGGMFRTKTMSADNIEATFALNSVAAFALTNHLHGALAQAHGRVVNIATGFLSRTKLNVNDLVNPPSYSAFGRYAQAKLALILLTLEQAERWTSDGISAVSVQPGIVLGTRFSGSEPSGRSFGRTVGITLLKLLGIGATLKQATDRYQEAAFGAMASGSYFAWGKVTKLPQQAQDRGVRQALWQLLEKLASD
ncbi:MAG TPA: SDR family NAD(P)-dependent oxidoreductase [Roseiflexaceae bacterium]|nr:SDR family NAD(P)-dependent oxidoreductase [Roseiflexaceae bacterium]